MAAPVSAEQVPVSSDAGFLPPDEIIFGKSRHMQEVRQRVERVASADIPILIQGESGTGKEVIAKLIHTLSTWANGPFIKVNCPAIPAAL